MTEQPQTVARHPGSRTTITSPNLVQIINRLSRDLARLTARRPPVDLAFTTATGGVQVTAATFTDTHTVLVVRSGASITVDLLVHAGLASVVEARLFVPALAVTGPVAVTTTAAEQQLRVTLALPETWTTGDGQLVNVQARRVSGTDTTTVRVARAIHR